jgi:hypothetical protein
MKNLKFFCLGLIILMSQSVFAIQNITVDAKNDGAIFPRSVGDFDIKIENIDCLKNITLQPTGGNSVNFPKKDFFDNNTVIHVRQKKAFIDNEDEFMNISDDFKIVVSSNETCNTATPVNSNISSGNKKLIGTPSKYEVTNVPWLDAVKLDEILRSVSQQKVDTLSEVQLLFLDNLFQAYSKQSFSNFMSSTTNAKTYFQRLDKYKNATLRIQTSNSDSNNRGASSQNTSAFTAISNPTMAIDALGTFIAERFKEELTITYLSKFKKFLEDSEANWTLFLPNTYGAIKRIDQIYDYKAYLNTIHEAAQADSKEIPQNLTTFLDKNAANHPEYQQIRLYLNLIESILKENSPEKTFEKLLDANFIKIDKLSPDMKDNLKISLLFLKNLKGNKDRLNWITESNSNENLDAIPLFIGLTLEKEKVSLGNELYKKLIAKSSEVNKIQEWIAGATELLGAITSSKNSLTNQDTKNDKQKLLEAYGLYILKHAELLDYILKTSYLTSTANNSDINNTIKRGKQTVKIIGNVISKNYPLAVSNLMNLLLELNTKDSGNLAFKYLTFATNIAKAETSSDLKQILEAAVLPVGSYRLKRNSSFSATINAFAGAYIGSETLTKTDKTTSSSTIIAPTAPVGIHVGIGECFGLFVPIVDVGGVATFRLTNSESTLPELNWNNVLSPGLYGVFNLSKNNPLTLMFGVQRGPELRKINIDDKNKTTAEFSTSAWRFGVSLTFDIPLFNIYSK